MLTVTVDRAQQYGVVKTQNNLVKAILEKPKDKEMSKVVNAGVYSFSPLIFKFLESMDISERGEYEITDALRVMLEKASPSSRSTRMPCGWTRSSCGIY